MIQWLINLFNPPQTPRPFCLLPEDDSKWKKIVELHYSDNILSVTTFDRNVKQFYRCINANTLEHHGWARYPSHTFIKDQTLNNSLNKCYSMLKDRIKNGEGWVKVF